MAGETIDIDKKTRQLGDKFYSDTNYPFETIASITDTTSSTSFVDVSGGSITRFFEKDSTVLIMVTAELYTTIPASGSICTARLLVDGVAQSPDMSGNNTGNPETVCAHFVVDVSAGSVIIKLQIKTDITDVKIDNGKLTIALLTE